MKNNTGLLKLHLDGNAIGEDGVKSICDAIVNNVVLKELSLYGKMDQFLIIRQ